MENYPYVEVDQTSQNWWRVELITSDIDRVVYSTSRVRYARTQSRAEAKGRRMLAKYKKKYGDLADPYRIR